MERRELLKRVVKFFFSLVAAALLSLLVYVYPSEIKKRRLQYVYLIDEDELPRWGVRRVEYHYTSEERVITNRAFLVVSEQGVLAFSPICTHLGCFVNWDNNKKEFLCPCHGGRYAMNGTVLSGPPPRPLTRLPMKFEAGKVYIGIKV